MYLLPPDISTDLVLKKHRGTLLGFFPCSIDRTVTLFTHTTSKGNLVPVFGFYRDEPENLSPFEFDSEIERSESITTEETDYVLLFAGADDWSYGMVFDTRIQAFLWIEECPYVDFYQFMTEKGHTLEFICVE